MTTSMTAFKHFEEVMELVRQTGDRCIVLSEAHDPYVIMDLASYRTLLQTAAVKQDLSKLTEDELLERINRDIAEWRQSRERELADYNLAQFKADGPEKPPRIRYEATLQGPQDHLDLPVEEDEALDEFQLEPME